MPTRRPSRETGRRSLRRAPFSDNPHVGARGQRTQQRILDAALRVFGEVGYHQCSIDSITKVAGCSRVSFYQYFSSKEDVFRHLAAQVARQLNASTDRLDPLTPDARRLGRAARVGRPLRRDLRPVRAGLPRVPRGRRERRDARRRLRAHRRPLRRRHPVAVSTTTLPPPRARRGDRAAAGVPGPDARRRRRCCARPRRTRSRTHVDARRLHRRRAPHACSASIPTSTCTGTACRRPPKLPVRPDHARRVRRGTIGDRDADDARAGARGALLEAGREVFVEPRLPRHPRRRHRRGGRRVPRRVLPLLQEQGRARAPARRAGDAHACRPTFIEIPDVGDDGAERRSRAAALAARVQPRPGRTRRR